MKLSKRNSLYIAGATLISAAVVSQFENADLIWATLMVLLAIVILVFGYKNGQKQTKCKTKTNSKYKILGATFGAAAIFFGLGFTIGKLIYLWSH